MDWVYSGTFVVYSVGDGLFMKRVMDAVAMLHNSGTLASLALIGLLLGLLLSGMKGIAGGGKGSDLGSVFVGLLLYGVMFAGSTTVQIEDIAYAPGETTQNVYVVDNVPFGVAFMGSTISQVGYYLTQRMEQAFGTADEVTSIRQVPFGRSLEWLAAVRFAKSTSLNSSNANFQRYRENLLEYMRSCSSQALIRFPERTPKVTNLADPMDPANGLGYQSSWVTTKWKNGDDTLEDLTCLQALPRLQTFKDNSLFNAWAMGAAGGMEYSGSSTAVDQARNAFSALGISAGQAQDYIFGAVSNAVWRDALVQMPVFGSQQAQNIVMSVQAAEQRATQFAGEESMFRRMMRPLMSFFECLVYAASPFMALAIGLGRTGIAMAGKYAMATLWVSLWMPTMAIINMFQLTMAERALSTALVAPTGTTYAIGSMAGSTRIEDVAIDWLATGSMLAASTPIITLVLLTGSVYSLVGLAGAMKGADVIDESVVSPAAQKVGASQNVGANMQHDREHGSVRTGAEVPNLQVSSVAKSAARSEKAEMEQVSQGFAERYGTQVGNALQNDTTLGATAKNATEARRSTDESRSVSAIGEKVAGFDKVGEFGQRVVLGTALSDSGSLSFDAGKAVQAFTALASKAKAGDPEAQRQLKQASKAFRMGVSGELSSKDSIERMAGRAVKMADQLKSAMREDSGFKADVMNAATESMERTAKIGGVESNSLRNSSDYQKSRDELRQARSSYATSSELSDQAGFTQNIPLTTMGQAVGNNKKDPGLLDRKMAEAVQYGGYPAVEAARNSIIRSGIMGDKYEDNPRQIDGAAAMMVLGDQVAGMNMNPAYAADRAQAFMSGLTESGVLLTSAGSAFVGREAAAEAQQGVSGNLHQPGDVASTVESQGPGAQVSADDVKRQYLEKRANANNGTGTYKASAIIGNDTESLYLGGENAKQATSSQQDFKEASKETRAEAQTGVDNTLKDAGKQEHAGSASVVFQSTAADVGAEGLFGVNQGLALPRILGEGGTLATGSLGLGGAVNWLEKHTGLNMGGSPPASSDFGGLEQYVAAATDGQYTLGMPLQPGGAEALVLGAMAAENSNHSLSQSQRDQVATAFNSLSPDRQQAIRNINEKWGWGSNNPGPNTLLNDAQLLNQSPEQDRSVTTYRGSSNWEGAWSALGGTTVVKALNEHLGTNIGETKGTDFAASPNMD